MPFPFTAILGQDEMKLALVMAAIEPGLGGVLVLGDRGTGKSTAVRGLPAVLPPRAVVVDCRFGCDPADRSALCDECRARRLAGPLGRRLAPVPVVTLPLGASQDRLVGTIDLERALASGEIRFEPGLLARAHRGFLYVDEVNLLEDHLVDLLLDVAASGENLIEREAFSLRHPARFVLVGSCNPEEGELRPQLLDRFGLTVEIDTPTSIETRVEIVRRREGYDADPAAFGRRWQPEERALRAQIAGARSRLGHVAVPDALRSDAARLCVALETDGLRGELTLLRAARALAAFDDRPAIETRHLRQVAPLALRHRLRRDPLDAVGSMARVGRALDEIWSA